eukprot:6394550-Alexandrium_andersonii.AAC.1
METPSGGGGGSSASSALGASSERKAEAHGNASEGGVAGAPTGVAAKVAASADGSEGSVVVEGPADAEFSSAVVAVVSSFSAVGSSPLGVGGAVVGASSGFFYSPHNEKPHGCQS